MANGDFTIPLDINDRGWIVGNVCDSSTTCIGAPDAGFVRDPSGRFTTINMPGSVRTEVSGVNNQGELVGDYSLPDGSYHGYVWRGGQYTTVDDPDGSGTQLTAINDHGDMIGITGDPTGPANGIKGFLLRKGRYSTMSVAGAPFTLPLGINNRGQIAGYTFTAPDGVTGSRGFLPPGVPLRKGSLFLSSTDKLSRSLTPPYRSIFLFRTGASSILPILFAK